MSSVAVQVENIFVVEYTDIGLTGLAVLGSHVTCDAFKQRTAGPGC